MTETQKRLAKVATDIKTVRAYAVVAAHRLADPSLAEARDLVLRAAEELERAARIVMRAAFSKTESDDEMEH